VLFDSLWKSFDSRFNSILEKLAKHKKLVKSEALTIDLVEARSWRLKIQEELEACDKRRSDTYIRDTVAWLNIPTEHQDDELDRLLSKRLDGTCEWILRHEKIAAWKNDAPAEPVLWVKGIPGAGMSFTAT
jgi:hypothetical protein